jgi:phage terminase large subunit-like protein
VNLNKKIRDAHLAEALEVLAKESQKNSFDPQVPGSKPSVVQEQTLRDIGKYKYRVIRAGNQSGKSTTCARELAWVAEENHPYWTRPEEWGNGPLTLLVVGQDRKTMEVEIWGNKLVACLEKDNWREVRSGQALSYVEHRVTKNKIIFISHSESGEQARKHMQAYVAHYVWIDEMPMRVMIFEELQRRIQARAGYMLMSFTPKVKSVEVKEYIDKLCELPTAKLYRFKMLDNPLYKDPAKKKEILAEYEMYSEARRNAGLNGDWMVGDEMVYDFNSNMIEEISPHYSHGWRHVESADPALRSKMGHLIFVEDPDDNTWTLIRDDYIEGDLDPDSILEECRKRTAPHFIVRRISDVASWFQIMAAKKGRPYQSPHNKTQRKDDLIKGLQQALSNRKLKIAPHCKNFIAEINNCQWSENSDRIVNSQKFHCLDAAQYFVDMMPPAEKRAPNFTRAHEIIAAHEKNKVAKKTNAALRVLARKGARPIRAWGTQKLRTK